MRIDAALISRFSQAAHMADDAARGERAGATTVEVAASHSVYVSQPAAVADLIKRAATAVAARQ
jgi:hypothetical protein